MHCAIANSKFRADSMPRIRGAVTAEVKQRSHQLDPNWHLWRRVRAFEDFMVYNEMEKIEESIAGDTSERRLGSRAMRFRKATLLTLDDKLVLSRNGVHGGEQDRS
jgi:hypothetical protein